MPDFHDSPTDRSLAASKRDSLRQRGNEIYGPGLPGNPHGFGGLAGRYRGNQFALASAVDPILQLRVRLRSSLLLDNWLLRNLCPGSVACDTTTTRLQGIRAGRRVSVDCALLTRFQDGSVVADHVVKHASPEISDTWTDFQSVARAHGYLPVLRRAMDIRANGTLLDSLDDMRKLLVDQMGRPSLSAAGIAAIEVTLRGTGPMAINALVASVLQAIPAADMIMLDAQLIHMYRQQRVSLNIAEVRYGDRTTVHLI